MEDGRDGKSGGGQGPPLVWFPEETVGGVALPLQSVLIDEARADRAYLVSVCEPVDG